MFISYETKSLVMYKLAMCSKTNNRIVFGFIFIHVICRYKNKNQILYTNNSSIGDGNLWAPLLIFGSLLQFSYLIYILSMAFVTAVAAKIMNNCKYSRHVRWFP